VASGGVIFTTIQKFLPDEKGARAEMLSDRRNIIVIADEAQSSCHPLTSHPRPEATSRSAQDYAASVVVSSKVLLDLSRGQ